MRNFRELKTWQKAHGLILEVYKVTQNFPREELYGLVSQMRRAGVSIPANIAEGCGKKGDTDFARCLQISMGSASELEYYFLLSRNLGYITPEEAIRLTSEATEVERMLTAFIQKLSTNS